MPCKGCAERAARDAHLQRRALDLRRRVARHAPPCAPAEEAVAHSRAHAARTATPLLRRSLQMGDEFADQAGVPPSGLVHERPRPACRHPKCKQLHYRLTLGGTSARSSRRWPPASVCFDSTTPAGKSKGCTKVWKGAGPTPHRYLPDTMAAPRNSSAQGEGRQRQAPT